MGSIHPVDLSVDKENGESSYRNILKGASTLGGFQIFNILVNLVRGKFVAVILGPEGMGFSSLFTSASNTLQRFSSLGVTQSIIRVTATNSDNKRELPSVVKSSLFLNSVTAVFGALLCVVLSKTLSRITFGTDRMSWQFMLLGIAVGFGIAGSGLFSVLQGLRDVRKLSRSSIAGSLTGLCVGVPLYYAFGVNGIVPAIIAISVSLYISYFIALRKVVDLSLTSYSWKEHVPLLKHLLLFGIVLMSGELIATMVTYLINLFVRIFGSIDDVGLYQAANTVTNQYAVTVFAACSLDYFPRLTKVAGDNLKMKDTVNRQTEVVAWLIAPAMALLILTAPVLIRLLLSESFEPITHLMRWMGLGVMLRAFSFPMAYISYAKGDKKIYFLLEGLAANLLTLLLACVFFYFFGLIGLGYALVLDNGLCIILYYTVNRKLYDYDFSQSSLSQSAMGAVMVIAVFLFSIIEDSLLSYALMGATTILILTWSFLNLKRRVSSKGKPV
ncbi:MAG: oligosaccharide flippase family protein [Muribaculaceae bacterium]|nr:oligosaccharide flippase family protein [Muribaculaceae bacterium]